MINQAPLPVNSSALSTGQASPFLDLSLPRKELIANAELAVCDLDQTLTFTKELHRLLLLRFVSSQHSGADIIQVEQRYSELRGKAYSDILDGVAALVLNKSHFSGENLEFREAYFKFIGGLNKNSLEYRSEVMPGTKALLEDIAAIGTEMVVCTGSPQILAELFIEQSGLTQFIPRDRMFCWGDTEYSKSDPQFWDPILGDRNRARILALDDHPHSVECVMKSGGIGNLVVLPSVSSDKFDSLNSEFPGRIKIVSNSWDNWE